MKNSNIIALCGLKNTGKDTSAGMLKFLLNTPKFLHWYWIFKSFSFIGNFGKWKTISFAKPLKEVLSIILGVPVEKFEDRDFKENYGVDLKTSKIFKIDPFNSPMISDRFFSKYVDELTPNMFDKYCLTIRQMLQYVGTELLRRYVSQDVWINATLKRDNLIISDLRFRREFEALDNHKSFRILLDRPGCEPGNHASEREIMELRGDRKFEGYVNNNGTLKDLFYKLKDFV